jgi:nucleoid DNA-binding protein
MTKRELILVVAEKADISQAKAKVAVEALIEQITDSLRIGEAVALSPLGTFRPVPVAAREHHGFGQTTTIPAHTKVKFSASKPLKDALR